MAQSSQLLQGGTHMVIVKLELSIIFTCIHVTLVGHIYT